MTIDPSKFCAVHDFPPPRNKKVLQSFVDFRCFYRKFADHHASTISPLISLLKNGSSWRFGDTELNQFNAVKAAFTERFLSYPNCNKGFYIQTDASKIGLDVELFQMELENRHTIFFASRTLNSAEQNYSITELKLLSIVFACDKIRVFLLGHPVNVITDHQALVFLF